MMIVYIYVMDEFKMTDAHYQLFAEADSEIEQQFRRELKKFAAIFGIGFGLMFVGIVVNLFFALGLIIVIFGIWRLKKSQARDREILDTVYQRIEEDRLEFLKSRMTLSEWENYKIQLENNALLKNIKTNQNRNAKQDPGISYGIIDS